MHLTTILPVYIVKMSFRSVSPPGVLRPVMQEALSSAGGGSSRQQQLMHYSGLLLSPHPPRVYNPLHSHQALVRCLLYTAANMHRALPSLAPCWELGWMYSGVQNHVPYSLLCLPLCHCRLDTLTRALE